MVLLNRLNKAGAAEVSGVSFRPSFYLLQNEGHLIRACLGAGLTEIRRANYADGLGRYYSGFFNLANGLERLMKVALILDHMSAHRLATPGSQKLRQLGHDLEKLAEAVASVASPPVAKEVRAAVAEGVKRDMVQMLNRFGKAARYHNFDSLAAGEHSLDPLAEWNSILVRVIEEDVPARSKHRIERNARVVDELLGEYTYGVQHGLDRQSLSLYQASRLTGMLDLAQPRAQVHLFRILRPLADALVGASDSAQATNSMVDPKSLGVPYMAEFVDFLSAEPQYIRKRKRWP